VLLALHTDSAIIAAGLLALAAAGPLSLQHGGASGGRKPPMSPGSS
jgi:hypothetical protein